MLPRLLPEETSGDEFPVSDLFHYEGPRVQFLGRLAGQIARAS